MPRRLFLVSAVMIGLALAGGVARAQQGRVWADDDKRDRDFNKLWSNAINDTVSPPLQGNIDRYNANAAGGLPFSAESTATLDIRTLRSVALFLRCIGPASGDTSGTLRFAVQVRFHPILSQDSTSTFPWYRNAGVMGAALPDSIGQTYTATGVQPGITAQAGEFIVVFQQRNIQRTVGAHQFVGFNGIYIPVFSGKAERVYAPYMSVRVRQISPIYTTVVDATKPRIILTVAGSPL